MDWTATRGSQNRQKGLPFSLPEVLAGSGALQHPRSWDRPESVHQPCTLPLAHRHFNLTKLHYDLLRCQCLPWLFLIRIFQFFRSPSTEIPDGAVRIPRHIRSGKAPQESAPAATETQNQAENPPSRLRFIDLDKLAARRIG